MTVKVGTGQETYRLAIHSNRSCGLKGTGEYKDCLFDQGSV